MAFRCSVLFDEYIGSNSCAICRQEIAKQRKYECPRRIDRWTVHESCFNLRHLSGKTRAQTEQMYSQVRTPSISGDGMPNRVLTSLPVPEPVLAQAEVREYEYT
jgi:hypothetical protein